MPAERGQKRGKKTEFLENLGRSLLALDHVTSSVLDYCLIFCCALFKVCKEKYKSSREFSFVSTFLLICYIEIREIQRREDAKVHEMIEKILTITVKSNS